ncbi:MAG: hypothetical protein ACXIVQ_16225 [Acidimicrobiales bacterium]
MPDLDDLPLLAPEVDTAIAGRSFRLRRDRLRRRRTVMSSAAVLALVALAAGSLALLAHGGDSAPTVVATPPTDTSSTNLQRDEISFEVIAVNGAVDPMGTMVAAVDAASYEDLWARSGSADPAPDVDLTHVVVVSITIPDDACPPRLDRFERDDAVITPIFEEVGECAWPLIPRTFVVALDRAPLEPGFTLRLPGDDTHGLPERLLPVEVSVSRHTPALDPMAQEVCPPEVEGRRLSGGRLVAGSATTVAELSGIAGQRDEPGDTPAVMCWYEDATVVGLDEVSTTDALAVYIDGQISTVMHPADRSSGP